MTLVENIVKNEVKKQTLLKESVNINDIFHVYDNINKKLQKIKNDTYDFLKQNEFNIAEFKVGFIDEPDKYRFTSFIKIDKIPMEQIKKIKESNLYKTMDSMYEIELTPRFIQISQQ
jgi:hypothetical protein